MQLRRGFQCSVIYLSGLEKETFSVLASVTQALAVGFTDRQQQSQSQNTNFSCCTCVCHGANNWFLGLCDWDLT